MIMWTYVDPAKISCNKLVNSIAADNWGQWNLICIPACMLFMHPHGMFIIGVQDQSNLIKQSAIFEFKNHLIRSYSTS